MKTIYMFIGLLLGLSNLAHADRIFLVKVTAQETPGKVCYLGVETDSNNAVSAILYKETDGEIKHYTLKQVASPKVLVKKAVYGVVTLAAKAVDSKKVIVTFNYIYDIGNYFSPKRHDKKLAIQYNSRIGSYEAVDLASNRTISQAYATNHYDDGDLKGIDEIKTW
jgi:hypothetical protein